MFQGKTLLTVSGRGLGLETEVGIPQFRSTKSIIFDCLFFFLILVEKSSVCNNQEAGFILFRMWRGGKSATPILTSRKCQIMYKIIAFLKLIQDLKS
jgi:hypothetical protein